MRESRFVDRGAVPGAVPNGVPDGIPDGVPDEVERWWGRNRVGEVEGRCSSARSTGRSLGAVGNPNDVSMRDTWWSMVAK